MHADKHRFKKRNQRVSAFIRVPFEATEVRARGRPILTGVAALALGVAGVAGAVGGYHRLITYPAMMRVEYETDAGANALAAWLASNIPEGERRLVMVNNWDQFSGPALEWAFLAFQPGGTGRPHDFHDQAIAVLWPQSPSPEAVQAAQAEWDAQRVRYVVVFEGSPEGCGQCWLGYYDLLRPRLAPVAETSLTLHGWDEELLDRLRLGQLVAGPELDQALADGYHDQSITAYLYRYLPSP